MISRGGKISDDCFESQLGISRYIFDMYYIFFKQDGAEFSLKPLC
jgi:hypothetical protein